MINFLSEECVFVAETKNIHCRAERGSLQYEPIYKLLCTDFRSLGNCAEIEYCIFASKVSKNKKRLKKIYYWHTVHWTEM